MAARLHRPAHAETHGVEADTGLDAGKAGGVGCKRGVQLVAYRFAQLVPLDLNNRADAAQRENVEGRNDGLAKPGTRIDQLVNKCAEIQFENGCTRLQQSADNLAAASTRRDAMISIPDRMPRKNRPIGPRESPRSPM